MRQRSGVEGSIETHVGNAAAIAPAQTLKPGLSLFDSVTLVAGSMIGSGIFIVSADIARQVGSPAALIAVWLVAGLMTIAGALAYGELAAMMPQAGGQYVYLREAYGGLVAFLFGWTLLLIVQTGTVAAVAVAFGRFSGVIFPQIKSEMWIGIGGIGISGERFVAIAVIAFLTWGNLRGLRLGTIIQNLFTSAKLLSLLMISLVGCFLVRNPAAIAANFGSASAFLGTRPLNLGFAAIFGAAMVGSLFSADAWASVTFTAAEIRNPRRDLPLALAFGTGVVIFLYIMTNFAYMSQLPVTGDAAGATVFARGISHATSDRVASAAMQMVWGGAGAWITAILVMISTFGCANGLILTGARVIYAMAHDRVFFPAAGRLNRASVPAFALVIQGIWASLLTLSGTYSQLLDYVIFAQLLFYVVTVAAVFVLRRKLPDAPRPYRAFGYPWIPLAYILAAGAMMLDLLIVRPAYTWPGLLIVLAGVPVYLLFARPRATSAAA
jgi:basic amino acid/polyamine antiporter, APA family